MWYDDLPTTQQKATQKGYAEWLTETFHPQIYLTLTFAHAQSSRGGDSQFRQFINLVEKRFRAPVGWFRFEETKSWSGCGIADVALHYHVLLCCSTILDPQAIEDEWHQLGHFKKNALAVPFDPTDNAIYYCTKFLHQSNWQVGHLHFFVPTPHPTNHVARRRCRRQQLRSVRSTSTFFSQRAA